MERLLIYAWPGNVRELRNAIEYAFVLCPAGEIDVQHLPPKIIQIGTVCEPTFDAPPIDQLERERLIRILRQTGGNQSETARLLGVSRVTVWKRIKKYAIDLKKV
jgi:transcriptional regulator of acetoin/glycerol metabolism